MYLHEHPEFSDLIRIVAANKKIIPQLVEKDYWIMHCLHGLSEQGFNFELKGGTSLSKGYKIIHRFSEDIDIRINQDCCTEIDVKIGKNQDKAKHRESRQAFYAWLAGNIQIPGISDVTRDVEFDDIPRYRSGGIRLLYKSHFEDVEGLKEGILLELGFDDTTPNEQLTISSWAYDYALTADISFTDNRAKSVKCYHPGYTFVEKLQTVSTKFRQQRANNAFPMNFMRHYYDIYCLLENDLVWEFIRSPKYAKRKDERFPRADNQVIAENEAFLLSNEEVRALYNDAYRRSQALYYQDQPSL